MSLIPLQDQVTVVTSSGIDNWGVPIEDKAFTYNCRMTEKSEKVLNNNGEEVISKTRFIIEGVADVDYDSTIEWVDSIGYEQSDSPLSIGFIKDMDGTVLFTKVNV